MPDVFDTLNTPATAKGDIFDQVVEGPTPSAGASPASFQPAIDYGQRMAMSPEELSQRIQAASPALEKGVALAKTPSPEWLQPAEKFMRTPLVSPEAINSLFQPVIPASVAADPVAQGIGQGASEAASQFTSPGNLALLPLIPEGAMGRVVAGGFTAQGLAQYPDLYRRFQATDDPKEKARILATAAVLTAPAVGLKPRGRAAAVPERVSESLSSESTLEAPAPQPNVPEGYARFQGPEAAGRIESPAPPQSGTVPIPTIGETQAGNIGTSHESDLKGNVPDISQPNISEVPPSATEMVESAVTAPNQYARFQAPQTTADITRVILDRRKVLQAEADKLAEQADISRKMGQQVHPAVENRINEINAELANPIIPENIAPEEVTQNAEGIRENAGQIPERGIEQAQSAGESSQNLERQAQGQPDRGAGPEVAPPVTDAEPHISAIANRFSQERAASGEIGEIAPGQGVATADLVQRGLRMPPERVAEAVSRTMQSGKVPVDDAAAIRGEEARLSQRSNQLSKAAGDAPSNITARLAADNAFKDLTDFHNGPVARLKNNWHAQGMSMQGEIPVDLSTFNGLREKWLRDTGETPPTSIEPTLRRAADRVAKTVGEEQVAMKRLGGEVEKATRGRKLPTADEVRNNIRERLGLEPCKV